MVPNGWTLEPFGKLLISSNQGVNTTTECIEYSNSGYAAIRSNNVIEGGFDFSDEKFVDEQTFLRVSSRFKPNIGDVLYCNIGSNLGSACVNTFDQEFLITWNVFRAVPKNDFLSSEYCAYILNFKRLDLRRYATESTMPFISSKVLLQYKLLVPPLDEQVKIVEILSTWDQAISATEQLLANSQQQKKALMQQLLTGKKRLLDENGVRFSGEWGRYTLANFGKCIRGVNYKPENICSDEQASTVRLLRSTNIQDGSLNDRDLVILPRELVKSAQILSPGDLAICMANGSKALVGKSAPFLEREVPYTVGAFCAIFRPLKSADAKFVKFIFESVEYFSQLLVILAGSSINNLKGSDIELIKIKAPISIQEQQKIASVLATADQEIEVLQKKLECLKQEKKALMQQLLTGKRRVKVAA